MVPRFTTSEAFKEAFVHDEHFILGRKMLPFCLRHHLILESIQSPIIIGGSITIKDLQAAVTVCSTKSFSEWRQSFHAPSFKWIAWKRFSSMLPLSENVKAFEDYVSDFIPSFPFWDSGKGDDLKCPPFFVVASRLLGSFTREEIMNAPLGEVVAWGLAKMEAEGNSPDSLMSEADVSALKQIESEETSK